MAEIENKINPAEANPRETPQTRKAWVFHALVGLTLLLVLLAGIYAIQQNWPGYTGFGLPSSPPAQPSALPQSATPTALPLTNTSTPTPTATPEPATATIEFPDINPTQAVLLPLISPVEPIGVMVVSIQEGIYNRLFLYEPQTLAFTRITWGPWDDIAPAPSPDGRWIAFSSNRSGAWNLYLLDLITGETRPLTESAFYEGSPSWSPDGRFLAYETNSEGNLHIFVRAVDDSIQPIQLTSGPDHNYLPAWSPQGRKIAFVSTRSGEPDIWLADLDNTDNRFQNISANPNTLDHRPAWSPDGNWLAWAANKAGIRRIMLHSVTDGIQMDLGAGDYPVWSPDQAVVYTVVEYPNENYLAGYWLNPRGSLALPPVSLPGMVDGLAWANIQLASPLPDAIAQAAAQPNTTLWASNTSPNTPVPGNRGRLIELNLDAQGFYLLDQIDEAFQALRENAGVLLGWDYLATLQSAYKPLTEPLMPGELENWLYTGRAIDVNAAPIRAGWMMVVREDYGFETYWRIYLRARRQDGTQGRPVYPQAWDLDARFSGDPAAYEKGGAPISPLPGYWVDFTRLAHAYSWKRTPALLNWRSYYQGARFNHFYLDMGLSWQSAMLELYPPEILITPTQILPITPSATPTITTRPTLTPIPSRTPTPTRTQTATSTPRVTPTASPTAAPGTLGTP